MNILALDSSGKEVGIAALECDTGSSVRLAAVLGLEEARQLSRQIMGGMDAAVQRAGWKLDDLDALAVGLGPGSWTGLRIGLSTCKTLAQVRGWLLVGVPSFDAVAQSVWRRAWQAEADAPATPDAVRLPEHFMLLTAAPCRPGEVYGKIFECHREYLALVQPEWIGSAQAMLDTLETEALARGLDAPLVLAGPGAAAITALLEERHQPYFAVSTPIENLVVEIGLAGAAALMSGESAAPLELQPLYLAPSAAERNLLKANERKSRKDGES